MRLASASDTARAMVGLGCVEYIHATSSSARS